MSDTEQQIESPQPEYALVEIFGHRRHYAEISDVERAGAKLLRVRDVDTEEVHYYGGAAIFSLTVISKARIDAHIEEEARYRREREEREAKWKAEREARQLAKPADPEEDTDADAADDDEGPF